MKKQILILGAGKSATVLIQYLQKKAVENNWYIVLADGDQSLADSKWNNAENGHAVGFDINDAQLRNKYIQSSDLVVSMLPAFLHILVAKDCVQQSKPLFTASYVDEQMKVLEKAINEKGLLFLCEMGLDPGIDHMSAMELIHRIQNKGGKITKFKSHCGGIIAPESDNNPWHYKISWNPRNIILAGKAGALFLENGKEKIINYEQLFDFAPTIQIPNLGQLSYYPNRNSLPYIDTYSLQNVQEFVRTTIRHQSFCKGWNYIIKLALTDETAFERKEALTIHEWFQNHLQTNKLAAVYEQILADDALRTQFEFMGLNEAINIPLNLNTNASILQWILENKWKLDLNDKDLVVMMHEITYMLDNKEHQINSSLVVKGENDRITAMAKTVGLPLAMGVCAYLKGEITLTGLHIPTDPSIYQPILKALAAEGIIFIEAEIE